MTCAALFLALSVFGDVHTDELRGFRIEVPDGWSTLEQDLGERGYVFRLSAPGAQGQVSVSVQVLALDEGQGLEHMLERSRARVAEGAESFTGFEEARATVAEREGPHIRVDFSAPTGAYHIESSFLVEHGSGYVLQCLAPRESFEEHASTFDGIRATFGFVELSEEGATERRLIELAARCGSELRWAADWKCAAARAQAENRLVLVVAFLLPGFAITETPRTSVFMDEDVIELVNERFVPLWYTKGMKAPFVESYGMGPATFGQGLLLATPEGEIVRETQASGDTDVAYAFLRSGLESHPEFAGGAEPAEGSVVERASALVARGELQAATELIEGQPSSEALRLRARILRLSRRGEESLDVLREAYRAALEEDGSCTAELELELALLLARSKSVEAGPHQAEEMLRSLIGLADGQQGPSGGEEPDAETLAEARLWLGLLEFAKGDKGAAMARWRALAGERPESRWAWQAAAVLRSSFLDVDVKPDYTWPDEPLVQELLEPFTAAVLPVDRAHEAVSGALRWLLSAQRGDGSWRSATELSSPDGLGPDPFVDAITALGLRALLQNVEVEGASAAAESALAYLLASIAERAETPPVVFYMDYTTWSDAMMLHALADAFEAGAGVESELRAAAASLAVDLASRQVQNGGWSYYVTSDLEGEDAPAQSISFTTAAAVFALARAREAGFEVPDEVLDAAVAALQAMRDEAGVFAYFLYAGAGPSKTPSSDVPGAAGRGPACELALLRAGESTEVRLRASIELFLRHADLYSAERGKVLMHAGPHGQGCHYLFFDYAHAALAHASLAPDVKTRARLLELVLACRQPDGSFLDTPILGRAYGTSMALIALDALEGEEPD